VRPLLTKRGCTVAGGIRLRTLADVVAHLDRRRRAAGGNLAEQAAFLERCSAGLVVIAGIQMHRHLGGQGVICSSERTRPRPR